MKNWLLALLLCAPAFAQDFASVAVVGNLFQPEEISGLEFQFDAMRVNGTNGQKVGNLDLRYGGIVSQTVESLKPSLMFTNGFKAVLFDGVDDFLNHGYLSSTNSYIAMAVYKNQKATTGWSVLFGCSASGQQLRILFTGTTDNSTQTGCYYPPVNTYLSGSTTGVVSLLESIITVPTGSKLNATMRNDGYNANSVSNADPYTSGTYTFFGKSGAGEPFKGYVSDVIIAKTGDAYAALKLREYLANKNHLNVNRK